MHRKIIVLVIALIMLFSVIVFAGANCTLPNPSPCGENPCVCEEQDQYAKLEKHREAAVTMLMNYTDGRGKSNFTALDWSRILDYLADGVVSIGEATDKAGVDYALAEAKERIGKVDVERGPTGMPLKLEIRIIQDIRRHFVSAYSVYLPMFSFFGYYNGVVALRVGVSEVDDSEWYGKVADISFIWAANWPIIMWSDGQFLSISQAYYEHKLLTVADLIKIRDLNAVWSSRDAEWIS